MQAIHLPPGTLNLISALETAGYGAWAVGGCVRDSLLGREPSDWDICTAALPGEVERVFASLRVVETGIKHGTVTVIAPDGGSYEITTLRAEGPYSDGRRPDSVTFLADIRADLSRRDFTVNAMAYSPGDGLLDLFGGREDLAAGLIRCVGAPEERFGEDPLRILRALRFAAALDFTVEPATAAAARTLAPALSRVSGERIYSELRKLLAGPGAQRALRELPEVTAAIFPGTDAAGADFSALPRRFEPRLAALLGAAAPEYVPRLRCPAAVKKTVLAIHGIWASGPARSPADIRRAAAKWGDEAVLLALPGAEAVLNSPFPRSPAELAVDGRELAALGVPAGPLLGALLRRLLDDVLSGQLPNEKGPLLRRAKGIYEEIYRQ